MEGLRERKGSIRSIRPRFVPELPPSLWSLYVGQHPPFFFFFLGFPYRSCPKRSHNIPGLPLVGKAFKVGHVTAKTVIYW
jgi:hypothetical protein